MSFFNTKTQEKQGPATELVPQIITEGAKRIAIELDGRRDTKDYTRRWNELVGSIAALVKDELGTLTGKAREEKFITAILGIMQGNLKIEFEKKEYAPLYRSLDTNRFDCDTSVFLVYDVAKKIGVNVQVVLAPGHALIKTNNFFFETAFGRYDSIVKLFSKYKVIQVLNEREMQSITHHDKGFAYMVAGRHEDAIKEYTKALTLNPQYIYAYNNRGISQSELGKVKKAMKDFTQATRLNPSFADAYFNLSEVQTRIGDYDNAIASLQKAQKLNPTDIEVYRNIGYVYTIRTIDKIIKDAS